MSTIPASAATLTATAATLKSVFSKAKSGDTIWLSGTFSTVNLSSREFSPPVNLDARNATFTGTLTINAVHGLKIFGGHYGSTTSALQGIRVQNSDQIAITSPTVVGNRGASHGIDFANSTHVSVEGGTFTGLRAGVVFSKVTSGTLSGNRSLASTSDGFDIAGSHKITITNNTCSGTAILKGNHPDCVQLWSIATEPRNSDITVSGNTAIGDTQGFTSFDPDAGGGLRIIMTNNRVDTTYSQGIACYNCDDSIFTGNILTTQPGATSRTSINIVGGSGNTIGNNSVQAFAHTSNVGGFGDTLLLDGDPDFTGAGAQTWTQGALLPLATGSALTGEVPEPGVWALLIAGFGVVGAAARRRRLAA